MYSMIKDETKKIRITSEMAFAERSHKNLDQKDVVLPESLDDYDSLKMLQSLCNEATRVREKLNKSYRSKFFGKVRRRMDKSRKDRNIESRYDEDRRYRERAERDTGRYDRDRRSRGGDRGHSRRDDYSRRDDRHGRDYSRRRRSRS